MHNHTIKTSSELSEELVSLCPKHTDNQHGYQHALSVLMNLDLIPTINTKTLQQGLSKAYLELDKRDSENISLKKPKKVGDLTLREIQSILKECSKRDVELRLVISPYYSETPDIRITLDNYGAYVDISYDSFLDIDTVIKITSSWTGPHS